MSDSYPTIQDALSDVQKEFMGCVEMHLDPPEHESPTYAVDAFYRLEPDAGDQLPADSVRFELTINEEDGSDISERRHTIEFFDPADERPLGWVRHTMKRIEGARGRFFWTESHFEVQAPGVPEGKAHESDVEREVLSFVRKIGALDRSQQLVAVRAA